MVDHCTFVGATDGALDLTGYVSDVTVSWNLFYGTALNQLIKYDTRRRISLHHNVYTADGERNPQIKGDARDIDFVSNAVYSLTIDGGRPRQLVLSLRHLLRNAQFRLGLARRREGERAVELLRRRPTPTSRSTRSWGPRTRGSTSHPTTCAPARAQRRPRAAPNVVPADYAVTATPVDRMA